MFTLLEIEKYTNGKIINGEPNIRIEAYSCSKKIHQKYEFYIPIIFKNINREIYIIDAIKSGGIGFLIQEDSTNYNEIIQEALQINSQINIVAVKDVNQAIYNLGIEARKRNSDKPIIAVTGSVGKTGLCSLISTILETERKVLHDYKNVNNNTSVLIPIDLMRFESYDMGVIELGTGGPGKMNELSKLVEPSIAIVNNIGTAHLNNFKTKEEIKKEKLHITDYIKDKKILFVNEDDEYLKNIQETSKYKVIKYSIKEATQIINKEEKVSFKTKIYNRDTTLTVNLLEEHYIRDIILAIKIAEIYKISYENIIKGIENYKPINGRFKIWKNEEKQITVIDDSYSASFESAKAGLETASKMNAKRRIAVLGKMAALGECSPKIHEELGRVVGNLQYDYLYLNGEFTKHIFKGTLEYMEEKRIKKFKTKQLLIEELIKNIENGDLIYIKASNKQNFIEIVEELKKNYDLKSMI